MPLPTHIHFSWTTGPYSGLVSVSGLDTPLVHGPGWVNMPGDFTADHGLRHVEVVAFYSLPTSPKLMGMPAQDQSISTERPFDAVTRKLKEIGAIHIDEFLSSTPGRLPLRAFSTKLASPQSANRDTIHALEGTSESRDSVSHFVSEGGAKGNLIPNLHLTRDNAISRLHQTCTHVFGSADSLRYEFIEENGQKNKQCILTVTRSDGHSRSYKSEAVFLKRADAKARAATLAVQMGALGFILERHSDSIEKDGRPPTSCLSAVDALDANQIQGQTSPEVSIEKCLSEWRAGKVFAEWIVYSDSRVVGQYGAALRIQLTNHSFRIHSCDSLFKSESDAKAACARKALDEGIIDYIKFGNGQTKPVGPFLEDMEPELFDQQRPPPKDKTRPMTLQAYYESLPQPFPESFDNKPATEINAPGYINTMLQSARGGRLKYNFYWVTDKITNLIGCLLRLERGKITKTYFVDCRFQKRNDAKSAACLLALSQGVGDYIRSVKASIDDNFTPEMRKLASEKLIFALNTECSKIRQGNRLIFVYSNDLDAFGASLEIDISTNAEAPDVRKWTVSAEYRSKSDAKLAVCYHAVSQGAIEVLRFKGSSPPPDHVLYWDVVHGRGITRRVAKRKSTETDVGGETCNQQKKRKKDGGKISASRPDIHPGAPSPHSSTGTSVGLKRLPAKRPLHTHLQLLNGNNNRDHKNTFNPGQSTVSGSTGIFGPEGFTAPQTSYYSPPMQSGLQHPFSPQTTTATPSSGYYQTPITSPIAYATYLSHSTTTIPENVPPHLQVYHPSYISPYSQPAFSPYYPMPSPYHSPYAYPPSSPMYFPQTPDIRMTDGREFHPEIHHHPLSHAPLHLISPPSTPPRPQRIKRIDRNSALSPLGTACDLTELEELRTRNQMQLADTAAEDLVPGTGRDGECLEPGELTEGEDVEVPVRSQVLERRASIP